MQGKVDKCQHWLNQLKAMLQPVLKQPSKLKLSSAGVQEPHTAQPRQRVWPNRAGWGEQRGPISGIGAAVARGQGWGN